jgi:hypothetical protein
MTNMFKVSDPGEARGNTITSRLGQMEDDFARRRAPHGEIVLGRGLRAISFDVEAFPDWEQQVFLPGQL